MVDVLPQTLYYMSGPTSSILGPTSFKGFLNLSICQLCVPNLAACSTMGVTRIRLEWTLCLMAILGFHGTSVGTPLTPATTSTVTVDLGYAIQEGYLEVTWNSPIALLCQ